VQRQKTYIAGHAGLVGSALVRHARAVGLAPLITRTVEQLDLRNHEQVDQFFAVEQPTHVLLAAARVGGIWANATQPASFIYDNLMMTLATIHAAHKHAVKKLLFFGSSCIYPRDCAQPICEEYLLTGPLELTNKAYAIAKIAGLELCQAYNQQYGTQFISCMPTNLYGPGDNFDDQSSHVIPALIGRMYRATIENAPYVTIWGTGRPRREFLFVDDLAQAAFFLMDHYSDSLPINVGVGYDIEIAELALLIKQIIGYGGQLRFDQSKPDGTPRKLLNVERITALGWRAKTSLQTGLQKTIDWYISKQSDQYAQVHQVNVGDSI